MHPRTLHKLELAVATVGQTVLLGAAWGILGSVLAFNPLVANDFIAVFMYSRQTETTWVITLLATIVSVLSNMFLSIAFKEALRHRMHKSISLIHLSSGIALARNSFMINVRHLAPTVVTLSIFGLTKLLVSSWATLLTPTLVAWNINASGWELDLTSSLFESMLDQQLVQSGAALVRGNSSEIIDISSTLSGIAAAQYSFGVPGIFDFNGVQYNVSTGGVLPAVTSYSGATSVISYNNTGLAFAGGRVQTHLVVDYPKDKGLQGLSRNYTLLQQGLTANVTCQRINGTASDLGISSSFNPIPVPLADGTPNYWLWAWNVTRDCAEGLLAQQQYVTVSNSSTVPQNTSTGLISTTVCPYPLQQSGISWQEFTVVVNATWQYSFLPPMICAIEPLVTTALVTYSNGVINTTVINSQPLGSSNVNLTRYLAAIVDYQSEITQSLVTNSIGDALYSIYVSASSNNSNTEDVSNLLVAESERYWRGVIEFTGTYLRSAFSAYPRTIPDDAQIPLSGNETILTMGWYRRSETYGYTIIPITIVALMLYAAVGYTLWHILVERGHESFTTFDPSNPIHVMMVSSTRDRTYHTKDNLEDRLRGFEPGGIGYNEKLRVQLTNVSPHHHKRFVVTDSQGISA